MLKKSRHDHEDLISDTLHRKALALLSVPLLAVPSAMGVQVFLEPESGQIASWCVAIGFEVLYIGINVLVLHTRATPLWEECSPGRRCHGGDL